MREAFALMRTLSRSIITETTLSDEIAQIAHDLDQQGLNAEASGFRDLARHHRVKVLQMQALSKGLEVQYGAAPERD